MRIEGERLANGGRLSADEGRAAVRVVLGGGRGCVLHGERPPAAILVPLRGRLQLFDGESVRTLSPGQAFIAESGDPLQAVGRANAVWIALLVPASHWQRLTVAAGEDDAADAVLLPALHTVDRVFRRAALRLYRAAAESPAQAFAAAAAFATLIVELQSGLARLINRCPGRTHAQRRNVFLRLQRVSNYMTSSCHLDLDIADFARMASYSACHFIRTFSTVYGETPHAVLVEQRLGRARRLINDSGLAITEIARASGFENRCAFARSFKRHFGITATELRESARDEARAAA